MKPIVLQLGLQRSVRDNFNETHFLADLDTFHSDLRHRNVPKEALCEIETLAKAYKKQLKQTPSVKCIEEVKNDVKSNDVESDVRLTRTSVSVL